MFSFSSSSDPNDLLKTICDSIKSIQQKRHTAELKEPLLQGYSPDDTPISEGASGAGRYRPPGSDPASDHFPAAGAAAGAGAGDDASDTDAMGRAGGGGGADSSTPTRAAAAKDSDTSLHFAYRGEQRDYFLLADHSDAAPHYYTGPRSTRITDKFTALDTLERGALLLEEVRPDTKNPPHNIYKKDATGTNRYSVDSNEGLILPRFWSHLKPSAKKYNVARAIRLTNTPSVEYHDAEKKHGLYKTVTLRGDHMLSMVYYYFFLRKRDYEGLEALRETEKEDGPSFVSISIDGLPACCFGVSTGTTNGWIYSDSNTRLLRAGESLRTRYRQTPSEICSTVARIRQGDLSVARRGDALDSHSISTKAQHNSTLPLIMQNNPGNPHCFIVPNPLMNIEGGVRLNNLTLGTPVLEEITAQSVNSPYSPTGDYAPRTHVFLGKDGHTALSGAADLGPDMYGSQVSTLSEEPVVLLTPDKTRRLTQIRVYLFCQDGSSIIYAYTLARDDIERLEKMHDARLASIAPELIAKGLEGKPNEIKVRHRLFPPLTFERHHAENDFYLNAASVGTYLNIQAPQVDPTHCPRFSIGLPPFIPNPVDLVAPVSPAPHQSGIFAGLFSSNPRGLAAAAVTDPATPDAPPAAGAGSGATSSASAITDMFSLVGETASEAGSSAGAAASGGTASAITDLFAPEAVTHTSVVGEADASAPAPVAGGKLVPAAVAS